LQGVLFKPHAIFKKSFDRTVFKIKRIKQLYIYIESVVLTSDSKRYSGTVRALNINLHKNDCDLIIYNSKPVLLISM